MKKIEKLYALLCDDEGKEVVCTMSLYGAAHDCMSPSRQRLQDVRDLFAMEMPDIKTWIAKFERVK